MRARIKTTVLNSVSLTASVMFIAGCSTGRNVGVTNVEQPGPVIGRAVGGGAGAVAGNVAGAGVGLGEGFGAAVNSTFDNTQRIVRYWREEKTPDGRVILVPENFLVDQNGRVIRRVR